MEQSACELCARQNVRLTEHHLTPKDEGGTYKPTAYICSDCHRQIHALYTNKELALRLSTLQSLKSDEKLRKFIKWIRKQPPEGKVKVKTSNSKRKKRRRR